MTTIQYQAYQEAVARGLEGLHAVSTSACSGCEDCGLTDKECSRCDGDGKDWQHGHEDQPCPACNGTGIIEPTEKDRELAEEPHFSWHACECCGSTLGGDRHPAHGLDANGNLIHFEVCTDCLYFLNYGQLDDTTMMEIKRS